MWSNRYWAKTYWAGNYWAPNTQASDVELLGGGGYVYIPASQRQPKQKIHITKLVERIKAKPLPKKERKDLDRLSSLLNVPLPTIQDIETIPTIDLLKEKKAIELLVKLYLSMLAKEEDELILLLIALDIL
jgi:hypothetical protein